MPLRRFIPLALLGALASCGSAEEPVSDLTEAYGTPSTTSTTEVVSYTDTPYDFTGPMPIGDLIQMFSDEIPPNQRVWYGIASELDSPYDGICGSFDAQIAPVDGLPVEIEGIVTIHPRWYQTVSVCQSEERFYGSYVLQDSTGGIPILKDSRIADFRMGDRVKLTVTGGVYNFGAYAVLTSVDEEVVSKNHDIYTEFIGEDLLSNQLLGRTVTIRRQLSSDATNYNFSELCLIPEGGDDFLCSPACLANEQCLGSVLVSLDREIEQRDPKVFKKGDILEITGPVVNSFGLKLLVARAGQISIVNE